MGIKPLSPLAPACLGLALLCAGVLFALDHGTANERAARACVDAPPAPLAPEHLDTPYEPLFEIQRSALPLSAEPSLYGAVVDVRGAGVGALTLVRQLGEARVEVGASAADGRFAWPSESPGGELWVEHPGWVCVRGARVDAPAEPQLRQLVVAREATIRGRVSGAGAPMPRARVTVLLDWKGASGPLWAGASATTGADGCFVIAGVPSGPQLSVRVSHAGFAARGFAFESAPEHFVELELEPLCAEFGRLHGVVLTHAGAPAEEHTFVVWGRDGTRCAADGSFELPLRHDPGDAPIVVRAPGATESRTGPAWEHVRSRREIELRQGPPLESLVGWIRRADGASELKGSVVELHRDAARGQPLARTRVDANGRYEFGGLERGEYWVRAESAGLAASVGPVPSGGRAPELIISR